MPQPATPQAPVILADVDTGIDDMLALIYLGARHRAGEITLAGVSVGAGNTTAILAANNTRYLLNLLGCQDIPVAVGARAPIAADLTITPETHGPAGLGPVLAPGNEAAAGIEVQPGVVPDAATMRALHQAGVQAPGIAASALPLWERVLDDAPDCRLLLTGPGTMAALHPEVAGRFHHVTVMGGAVDYPGNTTDTAEWNFWSDPLGAEAALRLAPTLLSLQVSEQVIVRPSDVQDWHDLLGARWGELVQVLTAALEYYFAFHEAMGEGYLAQVHDLAAAMVALNAVPFAVRTQRLSMNPEDRGAVCSGEGHPVALVTELDPAAVHQEFRRALSMLAAS